MYIMFLINFNPELYLYKSFAFFHGHPVHVSVICITNVGALQMLVLSDVMYLDDSFHFFF